MRATGITPVDALALMTVHVNVTVPGSGVYVMKGAAVAVMLGGLARYQIAGY